MRLTERNPDLLGTAKYRTYQSLRRLVPPMSAYCALAEALAAKSSLDVDADEERVKSVLFDGLKTPWVQTKADMIEALLYGYSVCEWSTERMGGNYRIQAIRRIPQSSIFEFRLGDDQEVEYFGQWGTTMNLIRRWQTLYVAVGPGIEGVGVLANVADRALAYVNHDRDLRRAISANLRDVPDVKVPDDALTKDTPIVQSLRKMIDSKDTIANPRTMTPSELWEGDGANGAVTFATAAARQYEIMRHEPVPISDNDRLMAMAREIALSMNAEAMLLGSDGAGSLALARSQTQLLYDSVDGALERVAAEIERMLKTVFMFNGWPSDDLVVSVDNSAWLDPVDLADLLMKVKDVDRENYGDAIDDVLKRGGLAIEDEGEA